MRSKPRARRTRKQKEAGRIRRADAWQLQLLLDVTERRMIHGLRTEVQARDIGAQTGGDLIFQSGSLPLMLMPGETLSQTVRVILAE